MSYSKLQNITYTIKASGGDSRKMHPFAIDIIKIHPFGREIAVKEAVTHKRAKVGGPMVFGDGFRVCRADAETGHKCHRRQGRSPRQVADALIFIREIRVFPPQAQTFTKNHQRPNADARFRRVCGICGAQRNKAHSLAIGREAANSARPRKIWKTWSKAERLSILERRKRAVLNTSAEPIPCLRKAFMTD